MPRVSWSDRAEADLEIVVTDIFVRAQVRGLAEEILHDIPPRLYPADEGIFDGIMWHRCVAHGHEMEIREDQADDPQHYFLFYKKRNPGPGFEVLGVCSIHQIAAGWPTDEDDN
jgi:plasmid stabilization system protein ParE